MSYLPMSRVVGAILSFWFLLAGQTPEEAGKQDAAEKLVRVHKNWGVPMNSAGASLQVKETSRERRAGFTAVRYHIYATGLPKDKTYALSEFDLAHMAPKVDLDGITLGVDGLAVCAGTPDTCGSPDRPNDPIDLIFPAAKGEVKHLALISDDGQDKAFFAVVPFPIRVTDKACTLEIQRLLPFGEVVYIQVSGLSPDADLMLDSSSAGENHSGRAKADGQGRYDATLLPFVKDKRAGTLRVTLHAASCGAAGSVAWGKESYRYE